MKLGKSVSELVLEELKAMPEWIKEGSCVTSDLDPFYDGDKQDFMAMCKKCPVLQPCRETYQEMVSNGRIISNGVFHGKDYSQ